MSVDIEKFIQDFNLQKAAEEEQKRIHQQEADATMSEIIEFNEAMAFALGVTRQEYHKIFAEPDATNIISMALGKLISWDEASTEWKTYLERKKFLQDVYEEKGMKVLRKGSRTGSTSDWSYTKPEQKLLRELTEKPKRKKSKKRTPWKVKINQSKSWQIAIEAQKRGVPYDVYVADQVNTRPGRPEDFEVNPFDADIFKKKK